MDTEELSPAAFFKCSKASHGVETLHLNCCQDPVQTVDRQDTGELITTLCQDNLGQSIPTPQESLSDLLGLAAEDW